jgi:hypothetical protein
MVPNTVYNMASWTYNFVTIEKSYFAFIDLSFTYISNELTLQNCANSISVLALLFSSLPKTAINKLVYKVKTLLQWFITLLLLSIFLSCMLQLNWPYRNSTQSISIYALCFQTYHTQFISYLKKPLKLKFIIMKSIFLSWICLSCLYNMNWP